MCDRISETEQTWSKSHAWFGLLVYTTMIKPASRFWLWPRNLEMPFFATHWEYLQAVLQLTTSRDWVTLGNLAITMESKLPNFDPITQVAFNPLVSETRSVAGTAHLGLSFIAPVSSLDDQLLAPTTTLYSPQSTEHVERVTTDHPLLDGLSNCHLHADILCLMQLDNLIALEWSEVAAARLGSMWIDDYKMVVTIIQPVAGQTWDVTCKRLFQALVKNVNALTNKRVLFMGRNSNDKRNQLQLHPDFLATNAIDYLNLEENANGDRKCMSDRRIFNDIKDIDTESPSYEYVIMDVSTCQHFRFTKGAQTDKDWVNHILNRGGVFIIAYRDSTIIQQTGWLEVKKLVQHLPFYHDYFLASHRLESHSPGKWELVTTDRRLDSINKTYKQPFLRVVKDPPLRIFGVSTKVKFVSYQKLRSN
jgi:hypothetical protein